MDALQIAIYFGILLMGILIGLVFGVVRFGGEAPVGTLKICYDEPEEDPYIFLELWEGTDDITTKSTVNLIVSVLRQNDSSLYEGH